VAKKIIFFLILPLCLPLFAQNISIKGSTEIVERVIMLNDNTDTITSAGRIFDTLFSLNLQAMSGDNIYTSIALETDFTQPNPIFFREIYADIILDNLLLRVGRQKMNWGVGFSWTPTNYFGSATKLDFFNINKNGLNLLNLEFLLNAFSLTFICELGKMPEDMIWAAKIGLPLALFDLTFSGFKQQERYGFGTSVVFEFDNNILYVEGAGRIGEHRMYIDNTDSLYTLARRAAGPFFHIVGGYYRIFEDTSFLCLEYYYNNEGWSDSEAANYFNGISTILADPGVSVADKTALGSIFTNFLGNLRQQYVVFIFNKPDFIFRDLRAGINYAFCINDFSSILTPEIRYDFMSNAYVALNGNFYFGANETEFHSEPLKFVVNLKLNLFF